VGKFEKKIGKFGRIKPRDDGEIFLKDYHSWMN
jgi:hypothetical protein